jgi:hypothetical protein
VVAAAPSPRHALSIDVVVFIARLVRFGVQTISHGLAFHLAKPKREFSNSVNRGELGTLVGAEMR